jgi:molybdopterin-containing oxidoreductase family iron-sulfur binding subunit
MEKCNFCIQRINEVKFRAKKEGRLPRDGEIQTACQQSCPTGAIVFGNLLDESSLVSQTVKSERGWKLLDDMVNTQPAVTYLADLKFQT